MRTKKTKMKEIKFRGKRIDNGKWIYGSLVIQKYNKINKYYIIDSGFISCEFAFFEEVIPETVGQFVGLKDSKGIEIYEGDILKEVYKDIDGKIHHKEVAWDRARWGLRSLWGKEKIFGMYPDFYNCEIIGNTSENLELLEKRK